MLYNVTKPGGGRRSAGDAWHARLANDATTQATHALYYDIMFYTHYIMCIHNSPSLGAARGMRGTSG